MTKTHFEKMNLNDLEEVMQIEKNNYSVPWSAGVMKDCIKSKYHCMLLKQDEKIIGYAILMTSYDESHLLNMCVDKKYHGHGMGRKILQYLENICIYCHSKMFLLEVRETNLVARNLYMSFGFKEIGVRKNYYKCINGRENAIVMTKKI